MLYKSTRNNGKNYEASYAIVKGISQEGGLFVPESFSPLDCSIKDMQNMCYEEIAFEVMKKYFTDFTEEELKYCIHSAYNGQNFDEEIAKVKSFRGFSFLELFHGKTIAFKDMALSILPYLMTTAAKKQGLKEKLVILTATSGDTGKAALEGFADVKDTKVIVFYPKDGVSPVQKQQMVTQEGENTYVVAIEGNFDDAQSGVKEIFSNEAFNQEILEKGYRFSSANSINIGRLIPQVVYYFYGYSRLLKNEIIAEGEKIDVTVPTGNFGNILAAFYAKQMGLPIGRLICASNENKVLVDFFNGGKYDKNRLFKVTNSPSMDILISSNLERLLYEISGKDTEQINGLMNDLKEKGCYEMTNEMQKATEDFYSQWATEKETEESIKECFEQYNYLMDTHTSVAYAVNQKYQADKMVNKDTQGHNLIVSTASPYKFTKSVMKAIDAKFEMVDDFALIKDMHELSGVKVPNAVLGLKDKTVRHKDTCRIDEMKKVILEYLAK